MASNPVEPLRDTLARIDALRDEGASGGEWVLWDEDELWCSSSRSGEWMVATNLTDPDANLIVAEHNAYPQARSMLERARWIITAGVSKCHKCVHARDHMCPYTEATKWMAEYEGARDA